MRPCIYAYISGALIVFSVIAQRRVAAVICGGVAVLHVFHHVRLTDVRMCFAVCQCTSSSPRNKPTQLLHLAGHFFCSLKNSYLFHGGRSENAPPKYRAEEVKRAATLSTAKNAHADERETGRSLWWRMEAECLVFIHTTVAKDGNIVIKLQLLFQGCEVFYLINNGLWIASLMIQPNIT